MNSRAYISAVGDMLLNGIDNTTMATAFKEGEIPDTTGARLLASLPCALALGVHYLAYTLWTVTFAILLANVPLRFPGDNSDTNPLFSKQAYRNSVIDSLDHLGLDKDGYINHILVETVFPVLNMAAYLLGFAYIGWIGLIAFLPATLTFAGQIVSNSLTLYNIIVPMVTSFPEITIMGVAIAVGGLITAGYDWIVGRMEVSRKNKEAEKLVHEVKPAEVKHIEPPVASVDVQASSKAKSKAEVSNGAEDTAQIKNTGIKKGAS